MTSTITCERGDVVLVRFVFSDEQGAKRRPVLVLSTNPYHASRQDLIVAALTSNVSRMLAGDHVIVHWKDAGLPKPSVVTAILRTIKASMIERTLGTLDAGDLRAFSNELRPLMGL